MDLSRQEYPTLLATLQPHQAVDVLNDRVRLVGRLNADIADWLQERRRLEEQYSSGLRKLARRHAPGESALDLGVFSGPWSTLVSSLETLADSHHVLAAKIETDVERPLRDFATTNREMQAMSTIQGNLASMARDVDNAQKKTDRNKDRSRSGNANSELGNAQSQWDSQAPYVFETLQAVDETRLNHLRDVLTQFQTHEVDQVERNRVTAEQCLNVLLNVETADEIKTFAIRKSEHPGPDRVRSRQSTAAGPSFGSPATPRAEDNASQRSDSLSELPQKESKVKGLRRLGTVLGRRRESKQVESKQLGRTSESPERTSPERKSRFGAGSAFGSLSSRMGRRESYQPPPLDPPSEERERPRSPLRKVISSDDSPKPSPFLPREQPAVNGNASRSTDVDEISRIPSMPNGGYQSDLTQLQAPLQPSAPPAVQATSREAALDSEGYSTRPSAFDPISQAEQDASADSAAQFKVDIKNAPAGQEAGDADVLANMATTLKMQVPAARRTGSVRGRRDMRASVYTPESQPLAEEASSPVQSRELPSDAFGPVATSSAPFPPFAAAAPASPTFSSPMLQSGSSSSPWAAAVAQNIFRPGSRATGLAEEGDNQSIRSGRSLTSTTSQMGGNKHPDLHESGLNASIIETVSAWFTAGQLTRCVVIGEVALAYNAPAYPSASTPTTETLRLDNFSLLEKVAPNPIFITPVPSTTSSGTGEYTLNLSALPSSPRPATAFKYQLLLPPASPGLAHAPLLATLAWKHEATQTSAIVSLTLNPAYALRGASSIALANVSLVLHLEGARAASCMSKPAGAFSAAKNAIAWQLGAVVLAAGAGAAPTKLLARFATDELATGGRVEARWETGGVAGAGVGDAAEAGGLGSALAVSVKARLDAVEVDPFADEDAAATGVGAVDGGALDGVGAWKLVPGARKLVSGTYCAV